jgi:tetratricopeptide (TPR) repeat protein
MDMNPAADKVRNILPIGIYRANITPIERLLKTTVGRQEILDDLIEKLERNAKKRGGQHYLFIGPRGIGKTHFLTLVENAVEQKEKLQNLYTVVRFSEENNRILSFADILLNIIDILAEKEQDGEWRKLHQALVESDKDEDIIDAIVPRLRKHVKETGKTLLLMIENLDSLFTEQMKKEQDIHRLRSFLMDSPCAALIGTSPFYFPGLYSNKSPFYDFFDITSLENLTEDETADLIKKNLEWEDRKDILDTFDDFLPKIYALHTMTGGNPRLTVLLYELIAHDNLLDVKIQFQKLLDQISPFYQDRLKELAPQERALLETIALMRDTPRTPAAIAGRLRMKPQQISSLLKRMTEAGYLTVLENPKDKRSRIYRIKEGFFDLWLAMSESRLLRKRLSYLTVFFEQWYRDRRERDQKRKELWEKLEKDLEYPKQNYREQLAYLSDVGDEVEKCSSKLELATCAFKDGDVPEAEALLKEVESLNPKSAMLCWITEKANSWIKGDESSDLDVQKWLDNMVEYWKTQHTGDLEKAVDIIQRLALDLSDKGLHKVRIELLNEALQNAQKPDERVLILLDIANSYQMQGMLTEALETLNRVLDECRKVGNREGEGTALNNISTIYSARGDYDTALKYLEESLKIYREIGDRKGEGTTLNNISQIYDAQGDYDTSLKYLEESHNISRNISNKRVQGATLNNISHVYIAKQDYDTALKYLEESLMIRREIGERVGIANSLFNIGCLEFKKNNPDKAAGLMSEAWQIAVELKHAEALFNIGRIFGKILTGRRQLDEGLKILSIAYEVGKTAGFAGVDELKATIEKFTAETGNNN